MLLNALLLDEYSDALVSSPVCSAGNTLPLTRTQFSAGNIRTRVMSTKKTRPCNLKRKKEHASTRPSSTAWHVSSPPPSHCVWSTNDQQEHCSGSSLCKWIPLQCQFTYLYLVIIGLPDERVSLNTALLNTLLMNESVSAQLLPHCWERIAGFNRRSRTDRMTHLSLSPGSQ